MSNFKVGQKVVCVIEDNFSDKVYNIQGYGPKINEIVTINWVGIAEGTPCLGFEEYTYYNACWDDFQFRPLDNAFADEVESMIKEQLKEEYV